MWKESSSKRRWSIFFLSSMISLHMETALGPSHDLARRQANKWTPIAPLPEVAAAQIDVPSAPTCSAKGPSALLPLGLCFGFSAISDTLRPYARCRLGVLGRSSANSAPNFRAVICVDPSSASRFLFADSAVPSPLYSNGASSFTREKSKLILASVSVIPERRTLRPLRDAQLKPFRPVNSYYVGALSQSQQYRCRSCCHPNQLGFLTQAYEIGRIRTGAIGGCKALCNSWPCTRLSSCSPLPVQPLPVQLQILCLDRAQHLHLCFRCYGKTQSYS